MTEQAASPGMTGIRGARHRVNSDTAQVRLSHLPQSETLPLVVSPSRSGVDLAEWAGLHQDTIEDQLATYGALLFRGFDINSPAMFEAAATALAGEALYGEYGDLPREAAGEKIFGSTPYPADQMIYWHNESSHLAHWPMRIFFNCSVASETQGETPLLDCRRAYQVLPSEVADRFKALGLRYVRNFAAGVDVPWQQFFSTDDPAEVERKCEETGTRYEWLHGHEQLRIMQDTSAVSSHPVTGDEVFFNQILLHHPAALPPATRNALLELMAEEDLPRNVYYGDGSTIPDSVIEQVLELYRAISVSERWRVGDVIMLDNMLAAHGRNPFTGARKIHVAMAAIR